MKVTTREERDKKAAEKLKNWEYFEKFMIEIWQWKRLEGGIEMCWNYVPAEEIQTRFKAWLKPKKK